PVPTSTILTFKNPCFSSSRFGPPDMVVHQRRESTPVFAYQPVPELPEYRPVNFPEHGGDILKQIPLSAADYQYYNSEPSSYGVLTINKLDPTITHGAVVEAYW